MEWAIECNAIGKRFGVYTAIQDVTFCLPKGSIMGILGPNGAGKTTLIRVLCGITPPSSGVATIFGYDIHKDSEKIKHAVGYMSQKFSLYLDLTIEQNLDFYCGIYGLTRTETKLRKQELIERFSLQDRLKQKAVTLSDGWKQRVSLACAIVHQPQMLVLDEPTAGVDPVSRELFWNTIRELTRDGMTVLTSTHYLDEAESCHLIGFIMYGRMIAFGSPDQLKEGNTRSLNEAFIQYVKNEAAVDPRHHDTRGGGIRNRVI